MSETSGEGATVTLAQAFLGRHNTLAMTAQEPHRELVHQLPCPPAP